ncbi:MAG: alpha/beta fold hydrolase [Phycisphaerales bacterium]|nr:alpha/beta fold hydrolase [Phycisphaerales bacterium]
MRPHRAILAIVAAAAAAALAGCATVLMPTPVGFDTAGADPFARTPAAARTPPVKVLCASTRGVTPGAPPAQYFTTKRSGGVLRLCELTVDVGGSGEDWASLEAISRQPGRTDGPAMTLRGVVDHGSLWTGPEALDPTPGLDEQVMARFAAAVDAALSQGTSGEIYVFVHGFNTTVPDNAALAAGLFHYLGRDGAVMTFEWPSRGSVFDYDIDKAAAGASTRYFRQLIQLLATRTKATRIHVIAHSAGAPIALQAVQALSLLNAHRPAAEARKDLRLGRLVLVAPDMDLGDFRDAVADGATSLPERVSIYVSSRDKALDISSGIAGFARLGRPLDILTPSMVEFLEDDANVDLVDVSRAEVKLGSWLGHSYFRDDPWASTDVLLALGCGAHPLDRGLQRDPKHNVYTFGDSYPDRARAAAKRLLEPVPPQEAPK